MSLNDERITTLEFELGQIKDRVSKFELEMSTVSGRQDRTEGDVSSMILQLRQIRQEQERQEEKIDRLAGAVSLIRSTQEIQHDLSLEFFHRFDQQLKYLVAKAESGDKDIPWTPSR